MNMYGDMYDYSKSVYLGYGKPIDIICKKHGVFSIHPSSFFAGHGCPACSNRQRIDTKVFISCAIKIHKNRYDYSKVNCSGSHSLVTIICPIHGEFTQKAGNHLKGNGCFKCFGTPKSTTKDFIKKAQNIYGNKYDFSKVVYNGNKTKVCIICSKHGEWWVTPNNFLRGSECPSCFGTPKYTTEQFIQMSIKVHNNKYDYSEVIYDGLKNKVKIICPTHGAFYQTPSSHLKGCGCPECVGYFKDGKRYKFTKEEFLNKSLANHSIIYDYSNVSFMSPKDKVKIVCPKHGEFMQGAYYHARGGNCPRCAGSYNITTKEFVNRANLVHKNKYNYTKVKYKNYYTKVCIICPEHGEFWQTPNGHLYGSGCPVCPESNMEGEMRNFLIKHNIKFEQEKTFTWLKYKRRLFLDFFLPEYNIAIECQGLQHFSPVDLFGGKDFFDETLKRDKAKQELCNDHNIKVLYYSKSGADHPYPVVESYRKLLNIIKNK